MIDISKRDGKYVAINRSLNAITYIGDRTGVIRHAGLNAWERYRDTLKQEVEDRLIGCAR